MRITHSTIRRPGMALAAGGLALTVMLGGAGCSKVSSTFSTGKLPSAEANTKSLPPAGPTTVRVDSTALALNQPEQEIAVRRAFVERFQQLLNEQREAAARLWIERHPDLAWEMLRDAAPPHEPWMTRLAEFHDAQCGNDPANSWRSVLAMRETTPGQDAPYREARSEFMRKLRSGKFAEAHAIDLVTPARATGQTLLEIDAWHQTGIAHLLAEQPAAAVGALEQCVRLAANYAPHQAVHVQLLLSEARRRAGDHQRAAADWTSAVAHAADLLVRPTPIADPTFWDRAMYLQPVQHQWPEAVVTRVNQLVQRGASQGRPVALAQIITAVQQSGEPPQPMLYVAASLASWKLERGDPQGAVVAFKRAETVASPAVKDWLRIAQAKAMARMEQASAATAILAPIAGREDHTPVRYAAMADLGSLQLHNGRVQQGVNLLRRASEEQPQVEWHGKSLALADYALALLMVGEETKGLARLEEAKRRFEAEGDVESLAKCLWNEAQFLKQAGQKKELAAVERDLEKMRL